MSAGDEASLAAAYWESVFAVAGLDLITPQPPAMVTRVIASELERLVGGLVFLREGGRPRDLSPNPQVGMDAVSAAECAGLLQELRAAVERVTARSQEEA
ncbi:hypothetical protein ABZ402_52065 [Streptomyces mirabilis]|uniref:hypothetical protein n=1 Tax=Streptomyces mirabilis TaxID=68239 RepID=UPI0033F22E90